MDHLDGGLGFHAAALLITGGAEPSRSNFDDGQQAEGSGPAIEYVPAFSSDYPTGAASIQGGSVDQSVAFAPPFICSVKVSNPSFRYSSAIYGSGFQSCTGSQWQPQRVVITIQKYKGLGIWNNLNSASSGYTNASYAAKDVGFTCVDIGSQLYRVLNDAYVRGGRQMVTAQSAEYLRVTC